MSYHFTNHYADAAPPARAPAAPPAAPGAPPAGPAPAADSSADLDQDWIATSAFMILLMQLGFAILEAGCVRYKSTQSIVIKVILNTTLGVLFFWAFGYAFAFGGTQPFIGNSKFFAIGFADDEYGKFVFQTACATVASSIMSGGTAERMTIPAWAIVSSLFIGFVYPVAAHWNFGDGWLVSYFGYHDLAGSGNLHYLAGVGALVTAIVLKPRVNRFSPDAHPNAFAPFNTSYVAFGALILYACWLFFNAGTSFMGENDAHVQGLIAANTLIAGATGAIVAFLLHYVEAKEYSLVHLSNGLLTGLVAVTGAADDIATWAALIFGLFGGLTYSIIAKQLVKARIDDPIDAIPVHFGGGFIGTLLTAFLVQSKGVFYGKGPNLLWAQLLGLVVFGFWSAALNAIPLLLLKGMGKLRIDQETEVDRGYDINLCGQEGVIFNDQEIKEPAPVELKVIQPVVVPQYGLTSQTIPAPVRLGQSGIFRS